LWFEHLDLQPPALHLGSATMATREQVDQRLEERIHAGVCRLSRDGEVWRVLRVGEAQVQRSHQGNRVASTRSRSDLVGATGGGSAVVGARGGGGRRVPGGARGDRRASWGDRGIASVGGSIRMNEPQQRNGLRRALRPSGFLLEVANRIRPAGLVLDGPSGLG